MRSTPLGRTTLTVSAVCCGTWQFGGDWGEFEERQAQATIRRAVELGVNFFDTAQAYGFGVSERILGEALRPELKNRREEIVLATKGGLRMDGNTLRRDSSAGWLRQGLEESLRNLGVEYIDLFQVHWPDAGTPFAETAGALDELVREGKIRWVGVSNFDVEQMREFQKTRKIDALQPPYNLFRRDIERAILPYCQRHGIGVLVYGPLAHGLLGGAYTPETKFSDGDWRNGSPAFQGESFGGNLAVVERLEALAGRLGIPVARLAVAWALASPGVDVAIVGARRPGQLDQTAPAADTSLSDETLLEIEQIMRDAVPTGGPSPEGS